MIKIIKTNSFDLQINAVFLTIECHLYDFEMTVE